MYEMSIPKITPEHVNENIDDFISPSLYDATPLNRFSADRISVNDT